MTNLSSIKPANRSGKYSGVRAILASKADFIAEVLQHACHQSDRRVQHLQNDTDALDCVHRGIDVRETARSQAAFDAILADFLSNFQFAHTNNHPAASLLPFYQPHSQSSTRSRCTGLTTARVHNSSSARRRPPRQSRHRRGPDTARFPAISLARFRESRGLSRGEGITLADQKSSPAANLSGPPLRSRAISAIFAAPNLTTAGTPP